MTLHYDMIHGTIYTDGRKCGKLIRRHKILPRRMKSMIQREDILSMEYLKKTEFTGCHQGMRYRLEQYQNPEDSDGGKKLKVTVWPEPFNYFKTPEEKKKTAYFSFDEDGVVDAVGWMNDRLFEDKKIWDEAPSLWDTYHM